MKKHKYTFEKKVPLKSCFKNQKLAVPFFKYFSLIFLENFITMGNYISEISTKVFTFYIQYALSRERNVHLSEGPFLEFFFTQNPV
jgi:hypothetical protein